MTLIEIRDHAEKITEMLCELARKNPESFGFAVGYAVGDTSDADGSGRFEGNASAQITGNGGLVKMANEYLQEEIMVAFGNATQQETPPLQ